MGPDPDSFAPPPPLVLVVFGASGDLTARKLLPALAGLAEQGALPDAFCVVGVARTPWSDDEFRTAVVDAVTTGGASATRFVEMAKRFRYVAGEYDDVGTFARLAEVLAECDRDCATAGNRVFYLATVPDAFAMVATSLAALGCNHPGPGGTFARLVVEKP
ncbi:MAG TPA: hypothetical protein VMU09_06950, partial [Acidimicrobiales bacterium]|nr:hypothetical protein [Acidimicrobiales bacterium]